MGKSGSGSRITIFESLETIFGLKYLNSLMRIRDPGWQKSDPGSGMAKIGSGIRDGKNRIRDPGWQKSDPGSGLEKFGSGIRDGKKSDPGLEIRDPG
jgi:hypothetical protein